MQPYRSLHAILHFYDLQRYESASSAQQSPSMGCRYQDMAPGDFAVHCRRISRHVNVRHLHILEKGKQEGSKDCNLLHSILRGILHL